jgi:hypothetical protein
MFAGWDSFYLMIGGAAGALIGLMFVVATLTGNRSREQSLQGSALYMTPTVFGLAAVLMMSALTAVPGLTGAVMGTVLMVVAILGALHGATVCWRLMGGGAPATPHWTDHWTYGVAPTMAYLVLGGVGWAFFSGKPWAADALAAVLLGGLMLSIRNAWDLVTWLAPSAHGADRS